MTRAMVFEPGVAESASIADLEGPVGTGSVVVDGLAVGICGTDVEIAGGQYGSAPPGARQLVLGHESLGRVVSAPDDSGLNAGDLVVGIVRRPDPVPCAACAVGEWDMCRNGQYTERGINGLHGYGAEQWLVEPEFAIPVDGRLAETGVLVEPTSVVAKAWAHIERIAARASAAPRTVLVTGAGPIGLLAALLAVQRGLDVHVLDRHETGPKPGLVADLGAEYHATSVTQAPAADVIIECTGAAPVILDVLTHNRPSAIVCLTGVSAPGETTPVDLGALNRRLVLENDVVFGSVNANRLHYEQAAAALADADATWLQRLITRRVPMERWHEGLERKDDDIKVVVDLAS